MNAQEHENGVDVFFTPPWVVEQALQFVVPRVCPNPGRILDPCAGKGVFAEALRRRYPKARLHVFDIVDWSKAWREYASAMMVCDFIDPVTLQLGENYYDLAISNPPFSRAQEFIAYSTAVSRVTVFLLRQGFLASDKRAAFFREYPPSAVFVLPNRPCFTGGTSGDKTDYCFVCWKRPLRQEKASLRWLPSWSKKRRDSYG